MEIINILGLGGTFQLGFVEGVITPKYTLTEVINKIIKEEGINQILNIKEIVNKDSNNLNEFDLYKLLVEIHKSLLDESVMGIIVTLGTDRLTDIASLIEFSIRPLNKPVIFTGAMHTIEDENSDGGKNFKNSIELINKICSEKLIENGKIYTGAIVVMGKYALYAHSSLKINTDGVESFICSWGKPLAILDEKGIGIKNVKVLKKIDSIPQLYLPRLGGIIIENLHLGYKPDIQKLADAEVIIYIGTGDGNVSNTVINLMKFLSLELYKPQFLCSNVPLRTNYSKYETGQVPNGVITSILPIAATTSKLSVILRAAQFLSEGIKQKFILEHFKEDITNEFSHLND